MNHEEAEAFDQMLRMDLDGQGEDQDGIFAPLIGKQIKVRVRRPSSYWKSSDGTEWLPEDMETSHLANTIALCKRNAAAIEAMPENVYGAIYAIMLEELQARMRQAQGVAFNPLLLLELL